MSKPLAVIPTYLRTPGDLELAATAVRTCCETADCEVLVVDDASPAGFLVDELEAGKSRFEFSVKRMPENAGFARTVNYGLKRAHAAKQDAVLVNSDIEFFEEGWLARLAAQDAAVVGALLLYPTGLIQHGGVFFSRLHRAFSHRFQFGPGDLPEAQQRHVCPVTAALHLIRWETLDKVGLYDETFRMGFEDVDYCLRVFSAGMECLYEPSARAFHLESVFRSRANEKLSKWQAGSFVRLYEKWPQSEMLKYAAPVV